MTAVVQRADGSRSWWRRPWVVPLGFLAVAFLVYSLPPYLGFDPARSRVPAPEGVAWYYPVLVAHIGFATVAMVCCVFQVWPWFRSRFPLAHRRIGRTYVFAGALPAGVGAFAIAAASAFGPVASMSSMLMASIWLLCTVQGYRAARARRFGEHRKWMIRSFALTMSIISNRIWTVLFVFTIAPGLATQYPDNPELIGLVIGGASSWLGWTIPLLIAEWWLQRPKTRAATTVRMAA